MGNVLSIILGILFLPFTLLGSWVIVHPQEVKVILFWGEFTGVLKKPGLYWVNIWGRKVIAVSTKRQTLDLPRTVVADGNGNPIVIAAVVTFQYVDAVKVALQVEHALEFVKTQAMAVLKQAASKYPYESPQGHSLKTEAQAISREMVAALQAKVNPAGAEVLAYELSDLSYAPEIAQAMLVRQQAQALVDARKTVVEGAVEIVDDAIHRLGEKGLALDDRERSRLVSNLLTVICGETHVQPTYPIHSAAGADDAVQAQFLKVLEEIRKNTTPKSS